MKGETRYLGDTLGESARLIAGQGIRKVYILSTNGRNYTIDLHNVSPDNVASFLKELEEKSESLTDILDYRTLKVEHTVNDDTGEKEMKIQITPITHVYKKHDDFPKNQPKKRWAYGVVGHPIRPSFKEVLQSHIEAAKASVNKSDEVK